MQFTLAGRLRVPVDGASDWEETFTVLEEIAGQALESLARSAQIDDEGNIQWNKLALLRFLRAAIVPEDEDRWDRMMADKERVIDISLVGDVVFDITKEKADRPTGPQPGSDAGSRSNDTGYVGASISPGSPETSSTEPTSPPSST